MEQVGFPGNIGDSCAETFRWILLRKYLKWPISYTEVTSAIRQTSTGTDQYLRHPESPWREDDFSSDQWIPRATVVTGMAVNAGSKTGNGDTYSIIAQALIKRVRAGKGTMWDFSLYAQLLAFKLPYRWSDSKKWFENNDESSADYLNWFIYLVFCEMDGHSYWSQTAKNGMDPYVLIAKLRSYYRNEPNPFVLDAYETTIKQMWRLQ